jgi:hypothetical protein
VVTPESVAIAMVATLTPLVPIPVTSIPVAVPILTAISVTKAQADSTFAHADANLCGRWQSHRQHCGSYHAECEFIHSESPLSVSGRKTFENANGSSTTSANEAPPQTDEVYQLARVV